MHFGGLGWVTEIFYGVAPAVIALILHSGYRLAKLGMEDWFQAGTLRSSAFHHHDLVGGRGLPSYSSVPSILGIAYGVADFRRGFMTMKAGL